MEQLESSAPTTDIPEPVPKAPANTPLTNNHRTPQAPTPRSAVISNSVPTLRFPRPVGNRRLTNWVSTSHPDMMRPYSFPDNAPLDASITDGYEVIGTDGESQFEAADHPYERPASELGDDVQSLADTDTGTDAYTNDVDTDYSDEEEEANLDHTVETLDDSAAQSDEDDHEVNMTMVERSLEHPTELFTPSSAHVSRRASVSEEDHVDTIPERSGTAIKPAELVKRDSSSAHRKLSKTNESWTNYSARDVYREAVEYLKNNTDLRENLVRFVLLVPLVVTGIAVSQYMKGYSSTDNGVLTTVPVASVSSVATSSVTEILVSTSTVTSTVTATKIQSLALQKTASTKSVASITSDSSLHVKQSLCTASVHGRNEILLRAPQQLKASWLAKHAVMISVSRDAHDIPSEYTKITAVEEGFIIEVPHHEAYGVLDVSIATTRKPKIKETFHVNFGSFIIVDAFDAGKQLVKGFAQSVVDTLNGTTSWVEETCSPAFDLMSKPASVTDSIIQGVQDATIAALSLPGQLTALVKQPFPEGRAEQARKELWRTAQDLQDEASLFVLQAQLNSKLQWLRWSGQTAEYEKYLAAVGPYYQKKQEEASAASRARAELTKQEVQARRKLVRQDGQDAGRAIWKFGGDS